MLKKKYIFTILITFIVSFGVFKAVEELNRSNREGDLEIKETWNTFTDIEIAKWFKGAHAAISFSWDDSNLTHEKIGDILDEFDYKGSFFPDLNSPNYKNQKDVWKSLSIKGHEIGSHTINHPALTKVDDLQKLHYEIDESYSMLKRDMGIPPVTLIHPRLKANRDVAYYVFQTYLFTRKLPSYDRMVVALKPKTTFNEVAEKIDEAYMHHRYVIMRGHGLGDEGYGPIPDDFLREVCQFITDTYGREVWVAPIREVALYEQLREKVKLEVFDGSISLSLQEEDRWRYKIKAIDTMPLSVIFPKKNRAYSFQGTCIRSVDEYTSYYIIDVDLASSNCSITYTVNEAPASNA
jgi:peptidoglycan/xylan/chitin deacetylase (PgdA/CDA1 family)